MSSWTEFTAQAYWLLLLPSRPSPVAPISLGVVMKVLTMAQEALQELARPR